MKVAILTLHLDNNYGGILQAYALQTVLECMGHTVEVLQKESKRKLILMPLVFAKRVAKKILVDSSIPIRAERDQRIIERNTRRFIADHIKVRKVKSLDQIGRNDYDGFVVGSDQIWRSDYFAWTWGQDLSKAFLSFTKGWGIKRIAFAASFGVDKWEYDENATLKCREAAKMFDRISTREKSGVALCRQYLGVEAHYMMDPTMSLTSEDYLNLIDRDKVTVDDNSILVSYILDPAEEKSRLIRDIAEAKGLQVKRVNADFTNKSLALSDRIQPPVEDWLESFANAGFIVTDSFHACVFAIIFNKPFIVFGNEKRGMSRFESLLDEFGLMDHLIMTSSDYDPNKSYLLDDSVYRRLAEIRATSKHFLEEALTK